jgi:Protein of unknown function (DUF2946)
MRIALAETPLQLHATRAANGLVAEIAARERRALRPDDAGSMVSRHRRRDKWGAAIAHAVTFLAITVQVFLPYFVAIGIAQLRNPAVASTVFICAGTHGETTPRSNRDGSNTHHGLIGGCTLCAALATGQGLAPAAAIAPPLPYSAANTVLETVAESAPCSPIASSYQSRAPPSLG